MRLNLIFTNKIRLSRLSFIRWLSGCLKRLVLGSRKLLPSGDTVQDFSIELTRVLNKSDLFCLELTDLENSKTATAHATKLRSGLVG